ncbi:hypothetical protein [Caballeronia sordidicola]|uniref:hypothetical protein n=1 Tax=Caballeronia sordidicola TaxID=196367 RepID=UPI0004D01312|nr:hypothetical protein [Caballeronia sordidicola]
MSEEEIDKCAQMSGKWTRVSTPRVVAAVASPARSAAFSGVQRADETLNCQSARRNDLLDCSITRRAESDAFDAPVLNVLAAKQ